MSPDLFQRAILSVFCLFVQCHDSFIRVHFFKHFPNRIHVDQAAAFCYRQGDPVIKFVKRELTGILAAVFVRYAARVIFLHISNLGFFVIPPSTSWTVPIGSNSDTLFCSNARIFPGKAPVSLHKKVIAFTSKMLIIHKKKH